MQKLGRYNYTVEYKAGMENIAADELSRRPYHVSTKEKFVHFTDQRGQPLVKSLEFSKNSPFHTASNRTVILKHRTIRTTTGTYSKTQCDSNLGLVRIKKKDSEFLNWYLKRMKMP